MRPVFAVLLAALLVGPLTAAWAQPADEQVPQQEATVEDTGEDAGGETAEAAGEDSVFGDEREGDFDFIDDLLDEDENLLGEGSGFTYDPGDRRDPFRSLLVTSRLEREAGPRPEGPAGILIDEIRVIGVFVTADGPVALVEAPNLDASELLRPGDQLFDGDVLRITYQRYDAAEVVFKQILNDPTAPKPFREVVRRIEQ